MHRVPLRRRRVGPLLAGGAGGPGPVQRAVADLGPQAQGSLPVRDGARPGRSRPAPQRPRKPKPPSKGRGQVKGRTVATYDYCDAGGEVIFQALRYEPKDFRQRRPDGKGGWIWNLQGVALVPYRLPELLAADPAATVWILEGEKDVDRLRSLGLVATCNPMGAEKWRDEFSPHLQGRAVVVLADNDEPGRRHAEQVARSVAPHAAGVKVLDMAEACRKLGLRDLPEKGDVSDLLDLGGTAQDLGRLAAEGGSVSFVSAQGEASPKFTGPPRPIVTALRPVPPLRPEMLPMPMRAWIADIANRGPVQPRVPGDRGADRPGDAGRAQARHPPQEVRHVDGRPQPLGDDRGASRRAQDSRARAEHGASGAPGGRGPGASCPRPGGIPARADGHRGQEGSGQGA